MRRPDESRKVVVVPDVLVVVEVLPFASLMVAVFPASEDAGSAKARTGISRIRISFMDDLDDSWAVSFIMTARRRKAESSDNHSPLLVIIHIRLPNREKLKPPHPLCSQRRKSQAINRAASSSRLLHLQERCSQKNSPQFTSGSGCSFQGRPLK